jgi:hypothetical protein
MVTGPYDDCIIHTVILIGTLELHKFFRRSPGKSNLPNPLRRDSRNTDDTFLDDVQEPWRQKLFNVVGCCHLWGFWNNEPDNTQFFAFSFTTTNLFQLLPPFWSTKWDRVVLRRSGWMALESHLHWSFREEHVLLPSIVLHSFWSFLLACLLVIFICLTERFVEAFAFHTVHASRFLCNEIIRFLTNLLEKQWCPHMFKLSRISLGLWRAGLYSFATFLRL